MIHLNPKEWRLAKLLPALALLIFAGLPAMAQDDELLEPEKAFGFKAEVTDDGQIKARWEIADGYYMYRDKFSYSVQESGVELGEVVFPKGKMKSDPAFGDVEVYLHEAEFSMPVSGGPDLTLVAKGQGCNEPVGVCYPPIKYDVPLKLVDALIPAASAQTVAPMADPVTAADAGTEEINSLSDLRAALGGGGSDEEELLPPDEAFQAMVSASEDGRVHVDFSVADGYYMYRSKMKFESDELNITDMVFPDGKIKQDEYFGEVEVYRYNATIALQSDNAAALAGKTFDLYTEYQGCADIGVCYPPIKKTVAVAMPAIISTAAAQSTDNVVDSVAAPSAAQQVAAESAPVSSESEADKGIWALLIGAFLGGVLLTFTPCVLPLIPILSSVIAGQGEKVTKAKAGWLALVYVLGTATTYAAMGWMAGATGDQLQSYFQNVWAIGVLSAIFVLMALAMFDLYEIQMPSFIQSRMQEKSMGIQGGSTPMVFVLGLISALVVGACVSPVLISFLGLAISKGDPVLGATIMFAMAMGMGIPLIILGLGAGHILPKAGMWMDKVKYVFGVMLLGVAIFMLGTLPGVPVLLMWAALFIVVGVYLGATQSLPEGASGWQMLFKGLGTLLLIWGVLALIGSFYGERDPLKPLPQNLVSISGSGNMTAAEPVHLFARVDDNAALDQQFAAAKQSGKLVMIDYYADWCTDCVRMEKTTFVDPAVVAEMESRFVALQVDVTDPNDEDRKALKKRFGVFGPPAVLFFDANNQQIKDASFYGYKKPDDFLAHLKAL